MQEGDGDGGCHLAVSTTPPSSWLTGIAATLAAEMLHVLHQSDYWFERSQQPAGSHNLRHSRVLHVQPSVRLSHQDRLSVCPTRSGGDKQGGRGSFVFMDEENDTWTQTHNLCFLASSEVRKVHLL